MGLLGLAGAGAAIFFAPLGARAFVKRSSTKKYVREEAAIVMVPASTITASDGSLFRLGICFSVEAYAKEKKKCTKYIE